MQALKQLETIASTTAAVAVEKSPALVVESETIVTTTNRTRSVSVREVLAVDTKLAQNTGPVDGSMHILRAHHFPTA